MSTWVVFQQMVIILILIVLGYSVYKKGFVSAQGNKNISFLVLNVTQPAYVISTAFSSETDVSREEMLFALVLIFAIHIVLILFGWSLPYILRAEKSQRKFYSALGVYSNVGFIGIPVASAVLGSASLIYVMLFNAFYVLLFYSHGRMILLKDVEGRGGKPRIWDFVNIGTVAAVLTLLLFWFDVRLPMVIEDTLEYVGRATTFLAMMVMGFTFAQLPLKRLFTNVRIYLMVGIRYLVFPIITALILKSLLGDGIMVQTSALMLAMPVGNSPMILAARHNIETDVLAAGTLISTLFSVLTVTLTSLFV